MKTIIFCSKAQAVRGVLLVCSGTERGTKRAEDDEMCAAYILKCLISQIAEPSKLILDETATACLQRIHTFSW